MPVIPLSHLNRSVETRGGSKRPLLSDLRESGAIEQDADMVCFIYRPEYYKIDVDEQGNSTSGMAELIIAKHRNGALADVKMQFIGQFAKFTDYEGPVYDTPGEIPEGFDYPSDNSYTVPSKMNDMTEDGHPF